MTRRSKLVLQSLLVAGITVAGTAIALQPTSSQSDGEDLTEILGANPSASARLSQRQARERTRVDVQAAAAAARTCITDRITIAGNERGLELAVTVTEPAVVAADDDLALNWGFTVTKGVASDTDRSNFQLVASAIEIDCQHQFFDAAAEAHRAARRNDRSFMNDRAAAMAKCLRDDQQVNFTGEQSREVVRALAEGGRPAEPLASQVNEQPALRNAVTQCLLLSPDIAELPARASRR